MTMQTGSKKRPGVAPAVFAVFAILAALALVGPSPGLADAQADLDRETEAAPSRLERVGGEIGKRLKRLVNRVIKPSAEWEVKVGAYNRGEDKAPPPLLIPADGPLWKKGVDRANGLVAGRRALHVRWHGGEAPYRLNLLRKDDMRPVIPETLAQGRRIDLPSVELRPGLYVLVIKDAKSYGANPDPGVGPALAMAVEVLPASARPPMPPELAEAPCSSDLKNLLYAEWLTEQGDGEWILEAMQLVAPLAAGSQKAAAWLDNWGGK